jgi:hypothetical protein
MSGPAVFVSHFVVKEGRVSTRHFDERSQHGVR